MDVKDGCTCLDTAHDAPRVMKQRRTDNSDQKTLLKDQIFSEEPQNDSGDDNLPIHAFIPQ